MKENKNIKRRLIIIVCIILLTINNFGSIYSYANIKDGDIINLIGDHECDSLLEYWMEDYQKWSYKVVWYVNYYDSQTHEKYPAFCVEPAKQGVGTGYDSYNTVIKRENDNRIWRILNKGYMGSIYTDWLLECDDDLYSATKVALHSLKEGISPKDKYELGDRSVDGNTVEEIRERGSKVLEVAQNLYEYGIYGTDAYESPKINISEYEKSEVKIIENNTYYIQKYKIDTNKELKSYEIQIERFPEGTKILNLNNQEKNLLSENYFKIAIPIEKIKEDIKGKISIKNALIKTNPIYYCESTIKEAQSYVTYTSQYEKENTDIELNIKSNNCNLTIKKVDKITKKVIEGVTFQILDENNSVVGQVTTNNQGIADLKNILPGKYKIKEVKVPTEYVLSSEEKIVDLIWGQDKEIIFENEKIKGKIKILKISENDNEINGKLKGEPISNVIFEIKDSKGQVVQKCTTDEKGVAISQNLEKGVYYIKEIETDKDYILNEKEIVVEILENNKTYQIIVENKSKESEKELPPEDPKLPRTGF